jgi:hypothetical protein
MANELSRVCFSPKEPPLIAFIVDEVLFWQLTCPAGSFVTSAL